MSIHQARVCLGEERQRAMVVKSLKTFLLHIDEHHVNISVMKEWLNRKLNIQETIQG